MGTGVARRPRQNAPGASEMHRDPERSHTPTGPSEKQIRDKRKRLEKLHRKLYGRVAIENSDNLDERGGWIHGLACSIVWAEDAVLHEVEYPPGGRLTKMIVCIGCGAQVPPNYLLGSGHCVDCRHECMPDEQSSRLQSSASVIDFHQLRRGR